MARTLSLAKQSPTTAELEIVPVMERIADELQIIRNVLDEIRTDFQWAVQNGRIVLQTDPSGQFAHQLPELTLFNLTKEMRLNSILVGRLRLVRSLKSTTDLTELSCS